LCCRSWTRRWPGSWACRLRTLAEERGLALVIDVRRFGQPLFYAALEGTTPDNAEWVRRKSNVVARFHRSSYAVGLSLKLKNTTLLERQGLPVADYAADGGSFPLNVAGAGVVGSVTVSGLPQRADHELVVEALCGAGARLRGAAAGQRAVKLASQCSCFHAIRSISAMKKPSV
jgi:uncharacterized protein (UPF0303 family)